MRAASRIGMTAGAAVLTLSLGLPLYSQAELASGAKNETLAVTKHKRAARKPAVVPVKLEPATEAQFGAPLVGLTDDELDAFADGLEEFQSEDTPESGLGPIFNDVSCAACHSSPAIGGSSVKTVTRFGRRINGQFDPLTELGGSLLQSQAIDPHAQEFVPIEANVIATRRTTPLFGLGLIEAIPDATILANAQRQKASEVSGRASMIVDVATGETRVGRFGWKAQQATLLAFAGDAYLNEMGITNRYFPTENAPNGNQALLAQYDQVADPEDPVDPATGRSDIDAFADFMRMLAPPPQLPLNSDAQQGQLLFSLVGCDVCHIPSMQTGPSNIKALDHQTVPLYSDLLLHRMGSLADGIGQADAAPETMRTAPLWGLRAQPFYLHDGRARTVNEAIRQHDGEAQASAQRYARLPSMAQQQLLAFLNAI